MPGFLAAGLTLVASHLGMLQPVEHGAYSALFHIRGEQPWEDEVAVIEIDEASLNAIGPFPWPRHHYTDLIKALMDAERSIIAFDILFAESSRDDTELAQAMAAHGNVILATAWDPQGGVIGPNASVMEGARSTGHIHNQADPDGITRSYQSKVNGTLALSITAVQHHRQQSFSHFLPDNPNQDLWLNWRGTSHNAPRYSFIDVLSGKVSAETFSNKIIFVGYTGQGLDTMTTPYNHSLPTAGVYQHIVAANNLLAKDHLKRLTLPVGLLLVVNSSLFGYLLFNRRFSQQVLMNLILIIGWGGTVVIAFEYDYWLPIVMPVMAVTTTTNFVKLAEHILQLKRPSRRNTITDGSSHSTNKNEAVSKHPVSSY
ncbi:CHASE2 domain-containing protein [Leptothoe kymatousa]|nr:CHASE2 domain-containing protein [Leptothoe kymatousa]